MAFNYQTRKECAVKIIQKRTKKKEFRYKSNEIKILKRLNHPNIIKVYDFYETA